MRRLLLLLLLSVVPVLSFADDTYLTIAGLSYHTERHKGYNEINTGIGVEHAFRDDFRVSAGYYRNSLRDDSYYVGVIYAPLIYGNFRAGTFVTYITGYAHFDHAAVPTVMYEKDNWGVNVLLVPPVKGSTGVVGVHFKLKF